MTKITILGNSLSALCAAHRILDLKPEAKISIITDSAEIGLSGEIPGIVSNWPPCPSHWLSDMASQTPATSSTAVRGSWLIKAMGIQLSKRGCKFHLRTRVTEATENEVRFVGAGPLGKGSFRTDYLLDLRQDSRESARWYGFVCRTADAPRLHLAGDRSDGTTEVWSQTPPEPNGISLQEMAWVGDNPSDFISEEVELGLQIAQNVVDTIIHPVEQ